MSEFRIVRAADHREMPWKNGGGSTSEIAIFPPGATIDDFDWRLSMACVEQSGPFSAFAGIDRTLAILDGAGFRLDFPDGVSATLTPAAAPYAFPADVATECQLLDGPVNDLNLMTRRGLVSHEVVRFRLDEPGVIALDAEVAMIFCIRGRAELSSASTSFALDPRDTAIGFGAAVSFDAVPDETCEVLVMQIRRPRC